MQLLFKKHCHILGKLYTDRPWQGVWKGNYNVEQKATTCSKNNYLHKVIGYKTWFFLNYYYYYYIPLLFFVIILFNTKLTKLIAHGMITAIGVNAV